MKTINENMFHCLFQNEVYHIMEVPIPPTKLLNTLSIPPHFTAFAWLS